MTAPRAFGLTVEDFVAGVRSGDRAVMGRAITLVESSSPDHTAVAREVLGALKGFAGNSIRIGVTGVPGVGKSTFIESMGCMLLEKGKRVAVLAVDPSSTVTGGSILGDKTRMERLSRDERCFIRPTPSSGSLGGVARHTMETMLVCEAAGYDVIMVETVGVGQSEVTVRDLVDFFLLLMLPGAGDSLQGIKRGIMELADCLAINKADGENHNLAQTARGEYENALQFMRPATADWRTPVLLCSSQEETGLAEVWQQVESFQAHTHGNGAFAARRAGQLSRWFQSRLEQQVRNAFFAHPEVKATLGLVEEQFVSGQVTLADAIDSLMSKARKDPADKG